MKIMPAEPNHKSIISWYNERYSSGHEKSFGRPPEESVERLNKLKVGTWELVLLDVACGQGFFLNAAAELGHQTFGLDIAIEAVKIARRVSPSSRVVVSSGDTLPFPDGYFDVLTCWGSLEHHPDMRRALAEFVRVTKPDATVLLRVPNRAFWIYQLGELFGRRGGTEQQEVIEHLLSLDEWHTLFAEAGLTVKEVTPDNWFLQQRFRMADGLLANIKLALRKLALGFAPLRRTYVFDFLCKVRES